MPQGQSRHFYKRTRMMVRKGPHHVDNDVLCRRRTFPIGILISTSCLFSEMRRWKKVPKGKADTFPKSTIMMLRKEPHQRTDDTVVTREAASERSGSNPLMMIVYGLGQSRHFSEKNKNDGAERTTSCG
ncbi:hypothetical protein CEXT_80821 [Caerostris extrusa]|uniref:Uncharacterized protein n=1 Tax=Caerostris extrusa TaxID=172846 RepID=A0AAV4N9I9_CAEEX|nr:hypothetical protein CEXT_80821 [Caerostris extrusa]